MKLESVFEKLIAVMAVALLSSCGGGGGGGGGEPSRPPVSESAPPVPTVPVPPASPIVPDSIAGELKVNVIELAPDDLGASGLEINDLGGASISGTSAALRAIKVGDVILLPPDALAGRPLSFLGKAETTEPYGAGVRVKVSAAYVEDVFNKLSWQLDSANIGSQVVGAIDARGLAFNNVIYQPKQVGLLGLSTGGMSGDVTFTREFEVGGEKLILSATVKLSNVAVQSKGEFDIDRFGTAGGWGRIGAKVTGNIGGEVKIRSDDGVIVSFADLVQRNQVWKDLKWDGGRFFSIEGLGDDDKKGRVPLGGLIIAPSAGAVLFKGSAAENPAILRALAASSAVILWIYMDANGEITVQGETGVKLDNYKFAFGQDYVLRGTSYDVTKTREFGSFGAHLLASGNVAATYRAGLSVAADMLIGGIRPLNITAFAGIRSDGSFKGEQMSVRLAPELGAAGSWACFNQKVWAGVDGEVTLRVRTALKLSEAEPAWLQGISGGLLIGVQHKAVAYEFANKELLRGFKAVCAGSLLPDTMVLAVNESKRIQVVDPATKEPLRDIHNALLYLPDRIKWVVSEGNSIAFQPDSAGILARGIITGASSVSVSDELTGWSSRAFVSVGPGCERKPAVKLQDGKEIREELRCTFNMGTQRQHLRTYQSIVETDDSGNLASWRFVDLAPFQGMATFVKSVKTGYEFIEKTGAFYEGPDLREVSASFSASANRVTANKSVVYYESNVKQLKTLFIYCMPEGVGVFQIPHNPNLRPSDLPFGCPTYEEVVALNAIKLTDNPLYAEFAAKYPRH